MSEVRARDRQHEPESKYRNRELTNATPGFKVGPLSEGIRIRVTVGKLGKLNLCMERECLYQELEWERIDQSIDTIVRLGQRPQTIAIGRLLLYSKYSAETRVAVIQDPDEVHTALSAAVSKYREQLLDMERNNEELPRREDLATYIQDIRTCVIGSSVAIALSNHYPCISKVVAAVIFEESFGSTLMRLRFNDVNRIKDGLILGEGEAAVSITSP